MTPEDRREYHRQWRKDNPEKWALSSRRSVKRYKERHPEKVAAAELHWRQTHKPEIAAANIRRKYKRYGITPEQFDEMLTAQDDRCAICNTDTPGGSGGWCIDHDWACCDWSPVPSRSLCGQCIRGLLCHNCNLGLGKFRDDPERLLAAIAYVQKKVRA